MVNKFFLFVALLESVNVLANINHIDISKISNDKNHIELFGYVKENYNYFSHWTPNWGYEKSKIELDLRLRQIFSAFASLPNKNTETYLLLGDVAHYLYNLDIGVFKDSAISNYNKAIRLNPKDFRGYWFLGFHYAQSTVIQKGLDYLFRAEQMLPSPPPADFWNDYAWVTGVANMPSHAIFAMDKVRELTGKPGTMEEQMGDIMHKRIVNVDRDSSYKKEKMWFAVYGERPTFTSRPLGIKLSVDTTWQINVFNYEKHLGVFILTPPALKNKSGHEINYTIAIFMKTVNDSDNLDAFINAFVKQSGTHKKIKFSNKYEGMIAYEIIDKTTYADMGGGHLYMIGIERTEPKYPGFLLEDPYSFPKNEIKNQVAYYTPSDAKNRFKGKIFYALMLDSCEDIHEGSFAVFKEFFEKQVVIE